MLALAMMLVGCDRSGLEFAPQLSDVPGVQDLGMLEVLTEEELDAGNLDDESLEGKVYFGRLGAMENPQEVGGATFQFAGTGGSVCVVVDPEAVFWNYVVGQDQAGKFQYRDHYPDDGDVDLKVGLSAYYTGSPGVEIGDFVAQYTDPSGVEHSLEFNECLQQGLFGDTDIHAGRGTVEYCTINTETREGILYTVVLETFALPTDDSIVSFGTMVFEGTCGFDEAAVDECSLPDEVTNAEPGRVTPAGKEWFDDIEAAYCDSPREVNDLCEAWIAGDLEDENGDPIPYVEGEGPCDEPTITNPGANDDEEEDTEE